MSLQPEDVPNSLAEVQKWLGCEFSSINEARSAADTQARELANLLAAKRLVPDDATLVVYGSLARAEWSPSSDLDWSLLIDGAVDPSHVQVAHHIREVVSAIGVAGPGREGIFGSLSFSHDLAHRIGGHEDTNRNLTQRILLLLESRTIGDGQAHGRVVRAILDRYCEEDVHLYSKARQRFKVPRFLLNDVVRFWRTMAVDYASKRRERNNEGWALRNAKLRLSRKLLFVSGLMMCFRCAMKDIPGENDGLSGENFSIVPLINFLSDSVQKTPLEIISEVLLENKVKETARAVLSAYDSFLGILADGARRKALAELPFEDVEDAPSFQEIRVIGEKFQNGLEQLFYVDNETLAKLTRTYGMF